MKKNKIEVVGSFIIIGMLGIIMCLVIFFTIGPLLLRVLKINDDKLNELFQLPEESTLINYAEIYPFETNENILVNKENYVDKYLSIINEVKSSLQKKTSNYLIGYEKFAELSYNYNKILGYKLVSNNGGSSRIEISKGYYSRINTKKDVSNCAKNLIDFNEYLNSLGINFLYVQAPYKISENQKISKIYNDYTNDNVNNLLRLIESKVNYLDLRKSINKLDSFYKTDHHWLPETGLLATGKISKYINNNYDMNLNIRNVEPNNYNYKTYPEMYFGYDGRNVSLANAEPEDFTLITPKFDTKLNIKIFEKSINKTGSYKETLINWDKVKYDDFYNIVQYSAYMYGDRQLIEIKNEYIKNDKKILLIKDSFSEVVSPFLSLETEYLSIIDLRYFNGSLKSYINKFKPDMVITMYNGGMMGENDEELQGIDLLWNNLNK